MADRSLSGGGDGCRSKEKRRKVPGRGPGVAKLEKLLRLDDGSSTSEMVLGPQPLSSMMRPPFVQILQSSPSSVGQISVEPPSNQRFYHSTSSFFQPHQGDLMVDLKWPHPHVDNASYASIVGYQPLNLYPDMIIHRDTNYMKWNIAEYGSNFQESMKNEIGEGSCLSNTMPFYNFIQQNESGKGSDHEIVEVEDEVMNLDLELKL